MIIGIGIDAVQISRLKKWISNATLLERYFNRRELDSIQKRGKGMVNSLAAHFAAKEAFGKALGTGFAGFALKDIMVISNVGEKPMLFAEESAQKAMKAAGAKKSHVSLSHDGDMALAMVVLED